MKLILEPKALEMVQGVDCRRWEGVTDKGVPVVAWVRMVSPQTHDPEVNAEFGRELSEITAKMELGPSTARACRAGT